MNTDSEKAWVKAKGGRVRTVLTMLGLVGVASAAAFGVGYAVNRQPELHQAASAGDAMTWLRTEFQLDGKEFAVIKKMHDDYGVVCGEHCAAILAARARSASPAELAALEKTCVEAMTAHFQRVAALMRREQGKRYLATVLPRVENYDHAAAPNLQVKP